MARTIRIGHPHDLILGAAWTLVATVLALAGVDGALRVLAGVPFVLVWPGYLLSVALYPQAFSRTEVSKGEDSETTEQAGQGLDPLERAALSVGLSLALVPLAALVLNFTPLGVRAVPVTLTIGVFNLVLAAAGYRRRQVLQPGQRPRLALDLSLERWQGTSVADRAVTLTLLASIMVAGGSVAYILAAPVQGEPFTQFYVLGADGRASDYPVHLDAGANGTVRVGIANHQQSSQDYLVQVVVVNGTFLTPDGLRGDPQDNSTRFEPGDASVYDSWTSRLADEEVEERDVAIDLPPGDYQVRFHLYRGSTPADSPDHFLHLWVQVDPPA